ncbi:MAG TPA: Ig-like domain repeat protein [Terriglobales bacterium]|jgi:YVTN family beta-propeller protein|nr:Ig-like domain repeat protein [Terriglobales bacterium]
MRELWSPNFWRRDSPRRRFPSLLSTTVVLLCLAAIPVCGETVTATVNVGTAPDAVALNPVTNKIYIANASSNNVTVIDGATNTITTVGTGTTPKAIALNPVTNKIYVADSGNNKVTVINGADNSTVTVDVGTNPSAIAVNPVSNQIYVVNSGSNNVSVIDGGSNTVAATVSVGTAPNAVAVNPVTNKIYVTNNSSNTVTVIDAGNSNTTTPVSVGTNPSAVAVNPVTNQIYVANFGSVGSNSVTVIDANNSNATTPVNAGFNPSALAINPVTNQIYVANPTSNHVTIINGVNNATTPLTVGLQPVALAVNPVTNRIYVVNKSTLSSIYTLSIIDAANSNAITTVNVGATPLAVAVNAVTNKIYAANNGGNTVTVVDGATNGAATVNAGTNPNAVAVNAGSNKIYVVNQNSNNVTVIDGATNSPATVSVGTNPNAVAVNAISNKIYVTNNGDNTVTVIDAANSNATTTVATGVGPVAVAVNPVTNTIYTANKGDNTVTVIDGAANTPTTVNVGNLPTAVAVNPVSNKIYVTNNGDNTVTVIDAANSNATTTVSVGMAPTALAVNSVTNKIYVANNSDNTVTLIDAVNSNATASVNVGAAPVAVVVNPVANKIYVVNQNSNGVNVIDGVTNGTVTVNVGTNPDAVAVDPVSNKIYVTNNGDNTMTVIDGATNTASTVNAGTNPNAVAVNPVSNKTYVANNGSANVTVLTEQQVLPIPLTTSITPSAGNQLNFTTSSSYNPTAPAVQNVYFQFDTWQGPWLKASGSAPNFTGAAPVPLLPGIHIVYAYATDGQFADSTQPGGSGFGQSSPIPGAIAAYLFVVVPEPSITNLSSSTNPSVFGQPLIFTATVTSGFGIPSGVVTFTDDVTTLGTAMLDNFGQATFSTSTLTLGSHAIRATYGGNASFTGSFAALSQTVNRATTSPVVTLTSGPNPSTYPQSLTFTAVVNPQYTGIPTGTVSFQDNFQNQTFILSPPIALDGSAQASFTTASLAVGTHSVTAVYAGDPNFIQNASPALAQVVMATSNTTVALTAGTDPSSFSQSLTFTATVSSFFAGTPTGTLTFKDGNAILGSGTPAGPGIWTFTTTALTAGPHAITAVYGGDSTFASSTSSVFSQVVESNAGGASTTALTVNGVGAATIYFGFVAGAPSQANFVVNVTGGTDTDSVVLLEGTRQIGPTLSLTSGQASYTAQLPVGQHNIQAVYIGNLTASGSVSSVVTANRSPRPKPR